MDGDQVRSWCPGYSATGLCVTLDPEMDLEDGLLMEPPTRVLESCVSHLAQALSLDDPEADPTVHDRRLAKACMVWNNLLNILDVPDRSGDFNEKTEESIKKTFAECGWSGPPAKRPSTDISSRQLRGSVTSLSDIAESLVDELVKLLLKSYQELREKNFDNSVDTIIQLEEKANKNFSTTKSFAQRIIFTRFILFAFLFRACYSESESAFCSVASLSKKQKDDILAFLRSRVKILHDIVKRKTTFFSSSIKNKHQELMDDLLRTIYPFYSVSRGWSSPFLLIRDEGPEEHVELHINPEFLPGSEDKNVMLPLGMVLIEGEDLAPLHVFLWRDEKNLFLRRQEKVFRFVVTHGGPNSILHIQLSRDRIKSKNTLHPTLISSELPRKLLPMEKLLKDINSPLPSLAVYKEMALLGPLHLQALGLQVNLQTSQGQGLLHLAVLSGKLELVESVLLAGVQRHIRDNAGLHPLAQAILEAGAMDSDEAAERLVKLLACEDCLLDLPDAAGRTAMHHASTLGSSSLRARLVGVLVEAGAPLDCRDGAGDRPVDLAYRLTETTLFDRGN